MSHALRALPSVDRVLNHPALRELRLPAELITTAVRDELERQRGRLRDGLRENGADPRPVELEAIAAAVAADLSAMFASSLRGVINATGVVIHTNLGRAPLSDAAIEAMRDAAHYSNLEFDLATGARGSRADHLDQLLRALTGAEAAVVVNNNAAALYLALSAHAQGRGVIVSRGQAVEIGGGFRIPDVLRQSGATLVEVGTTNRTRAADYRNALDEQTAALLRVHTSNFRVIGFTGGSAARRTARGGRRGRRAADRRHRQRAVCWRRATTASATSRGPRRASRPGRIWCCSRATNSSAARSAGSSSAAKPPSVRFARIP